MPNESLPTVTVIIPTRPGQASVAALEAALRLDYPRDLLDIIVARGRQPSAQRNAALKAARGDLIYFLDDDSVSPPDNLKKSLSHFADPTVQMVGGPNLCPPQAPVLEQYFSLSMGTWLAFGPSRARYRAVGSTRPTSEKELILCNLMARRQPVLALGGFDESLYPNEENALMDSLQRGGGKLIYDPQFFVHRRPRPTLAAFVRMLMNYGRGRAEQFRLHPTPGSALNFAPPAFLVYLAALPFLPSPALLPLAAYLILVLIQAVAATPRTQPLALPPLFFLVIATHIFYGAGFWKGLFTQPKRAKAVPAAEIILEKFSVPPPDSPPNPRLN